MERLLLLANDSMSASLNEVLSRLLMPDTAVIEKVRTAEFGQLTFVSRVFVHFTAFMHSRMRKRPKV